MKLSKLSNTKLAIAVINQLGGLPSALRSFSDFRDFGIKGNGFIYCSDTEFYRKNQEDINNLLFDYAESIGSNPLTEVMDLHFFWFEELDDKSRRERITTIMRLLSGAWIDNDSTKIIANALACFALEEIAEQFANIDDISKIDDLSEYLTQSEER